MSTPFMDQTTTVLVDVSDSTTISVASADLKELKLLGFCGDAAWDTQAVSFQISYDGTNYFPLWDGSTGAVYSVAAVPKQTYVAVNPTLFLGARKIKVVSGAAQGDDTVVTLVVRPL